MAENKVRQQKPTKVRMTNPKLPGREIRIRPAGVKARQKAGWKVATEDKSAAPAAVSKKEG